MAQVFQQALAAPGGMSPYEMAMAELAGQQPPDQPMYSEDQVRQRIAQNNDQVQMGLLGSLSGDSKIQGVGGGVLKQALAARNPHFTARGVMDPLSGETAVDPAYAAQQHETRRGKVLDAALRFEDQRQRGIERTQQQTQAQQARAEQLAAAQQGREDLVRVAAGLKAGLGSGQADLKNELTQARIDALKSQTDARGERAAEAQRKIKMQAEHTMKMAEFLTGQLDRAEKMVGTTTTGLIGSGMRKIPGTDAYDLNRIVDTVKANIGFDQLQQMRRESPTGGALGQVAIKELDMLQATLGSLDTAQDPDTVRHNIKQIKTHFGNIITTMAQVHGEAPPPGGGAPVAPPGAGPAPAQPDPGAAPRERRIVHPVTGEKLVLRNGRWVAP